MYFTKDRVEPQEDNRYLSQNNTTPLKNGDLRKSRLTLKMINELRKAAETHEQEKKQDLVLVQAMYATPPAEAAPA